MVDYKVLIGVSTQTFTRSDFYDYLNILEKPDNSIIMHAHDRSPASNRNVIVRQALINDCSHILFIDDDMAMKRESMNLLLEHDVDIVSGLYLRGEYPHQPLIFDVIDEQGALYSYLTNDKLGLIPIKAAGLGFCLVRTEVFQRLEEPWFRLGELDPEQWCDDIGFFYRLNKLGVKSFCDTRCTLGHIKTMILWPNLAEDGKWYTGYQTGSKGVVNIPQFHPDLVVK